MKFTAAKTNERFAVLLRRAGYAPHRDPHATQQSFARRLGVGEYPRFHLYAEAGENGAIIFNLHLDQKRPSYSGSRAHAGEYDGPLLEVERERILRGFK